MKSLRFRLILSCLLLFVALSISGAIAAQERGHFSVLGEANKPGVFEFQGGMTVKEAAVLFEGVTQNASMSRIVYSVDRPTGNESEDLSTSKEF
jgi:protein involved in polysaccharide export with SLBB domain